MRFLQDCISLVCSCVLRPHHSLTRLSPPPFPFPSPFPLVFLCWHRRGEERGLPSLFTSSLEVKQARSLDSFQLPLSPLRPLRERENGPTRLWINNEAGKETGWISGPSHSSHIWEGLQTWEGLSRLSLASDNDFE